MAKPESGRKSRALGNDTRENDRQADLTSDMKTDEQPRRRSDDAVRCNQNQLANGTEQRWPTRTGSNLKQQNSNGSCKGSETGGKREQWGDDAARPGRE